MAKNKKKKSKAKKIISMIVVMLLGVVAIIALIFIGRVLKLRSNALEIMKDVTAEDFRQTETSIIYDINGNEISTLSGIKELYYVTGQDIPVILKQMFVQIEDHDFYEHDGIDYSAIIRAAIANIRHDSITQGASTITQQLAKNMFLTQEVTWDRKITEMFVAKEIEDKFSKDQILEFYINNIYYANGYYGIEAAAQGYFGKSVNKLSISQLAFLAGIPKNPNGYDPVSNYNRAISRRDSVLTQIYAAGIISTSEYYKALDEEIQLTTEKNQHFNYVETYVFYCATRALMEEHGFIFRYEFIDEADETAYKELYDSLYSSYQRSLFTGGYRIYTSIDMEKQKLLQQIVDDELKDFTDTNDEGIYKLQSAAVCIDNGTGLVTAIVGGRSQDYDGYTLNRAFQSYRQPGSAIKPVLVYAPYLMAGHTPDEIIDDSFMPGGPTNSNNSYNGLITLTQALGYSSNVAAWKIMEQLTPQYAIQYLYQMRFNKVRVDENIQAISIGGFTYGVSPVELASAYATLENDGVYRNATCVSRITNSRGENIVDNPGEGVTVYTDVASRMVTEMMVWGVKEGILRNAQIDNAIIAAKSGTTNDSKDGWLAGYSRYYTTVVWVGCDIPETVHYLSGGSYPLYIWKKFMNKIHEGLYIRDFPKYEDVLIENETEPEEETTDSNKPTRPNWQGGGVPNIDDGDNFKENDGDGDNDADIGGMGDKDWPTKAR